MKKILITGARGYIGRALVSRLAAEGRMLRLVSRGSDPPQRGVKHDGRIEWRQADLRDESWLALLDGADTVVHLSARTDLRAAEIDPRGDDELNVEPVRALVRAAENCGSRPTVVFASTVTVVGYRPENPVNEQATDLPCSVYDRHKLECEMILREATRRGKICACSLRLSNVYGYGGVSINANRGILNAMMTRALRGETLTLFGDGGYIRDFTHLDDAVEAFRQAIVKVSVCDGRHYVIASGAGHTLAESYSFIADAVFTDAGRRVEIRRIPEPIDLHPIERRNFVGDSRLFQSLTGWRPRVNLKMGIRRYIRAADHLAAVH